MLDPAINMDNCPRLLMVPVVNPVNNGKDGEVLGFTPFFYSDVCFPDACTTPLALDKHKAWGYFLNMEFSSGTYTDYDRFGTIVIAMTE